MTHHRAINIALTFGLMLSDYLSRQVITPIFPALKSEWQLSDAQLALAERAARGAGDDLDLGRDVA